MNQLETTKRLSYEERKQLIALLEKYSKAEVEKVLRQLNRYIHKG